jgi:GAF domain-containing protein
MSFSLSDTTYRTDTPEAKRAMYEDLRAQLGGLVHGEHDWIANTANASSLVFNTMPGLNWAGFYFMQGPDELVLGPFQGKPACIRIRKGRGVCGSTVEKRATSVVEDVHAFPGHIACDAASRSELVVPIFGKDRRVRPRQPAARPFRCRRCRRHRIAGPHPRAIAPLIRRKACPGRA